MNNKETSTNGASLEDCRTNVFPLVDARGLQWRKFAVVNGADCVRISDDPVLASFSNAIQQGVLCTWQKCQSKNGECSGKLVELTKELVIFWYGEEPRFSEIVSPSLREKERGCFEDGFPYEYQSLLFQSLHKQLERQLIGEKFFCNGRWFTKSCKKGCDWETLAFSFTYFIYGESLVSVSVDIQRQTAIRCLSRSDLSDATSGDTVHVVLAPGGYSAMLTGCSLPSTDGRAARILTEWEKFYPTVKEEKSNGFIPCLVEIVHCDNKMLYPSCLVGIPVSRSGAKCVDVARNDSSETKADLCSRKTFKPVTALNSRIWDSLEPWKENKRPTSAIKTEAPVFGPNLPLWDFKDKSRTTVCGCTSSTNVNRSKPIGKFGSAVSGLKSASGHVGISSPATSAPGSNQPANVAHKPRKERKKTSLPFHQRRSTNTERSPTPPISLTANLKTVNVSAGPMLPSSVDLKTEAHAQLGLPPRKSPIVQQSSTNKSFDICNLDQSYSSVQLQNISSTKILPMKGRSMDSKGRFKTKPDSGNRPVDYILPTNTMPAKPMLAKDTLEARSLLTDPSFSSLYVSKEAESSYSISEVLSPAPLQLSNTKPGGPVPDGEVMIVRMPNKGVKRTTENANNVDESTKKVKLGPCAQPQPPSYTAASPPQSPLHFHSQADTSLYQQPGPGGAPQSIHQQQQQTKRGPGRPKKQSTSSTCSPKSDQAILENGSILSPPLADKRRRASNQSIKVKEEVIVSPPSVSSIKAAPVKGRRRPSKKDQAFSDNDMPPVTSPSGRNNSVPLSPSPYLPSPARTPGSSSGITFTQSKDLTVTFSDLDKLFEPSDDEDDQDSKSRQQNLMATITDVHMNQRASISDDVFRATALPPPATSLPHDLSEMFPTPPSQEAQAPAASPATSLPGDYGMPSTYTHCHAVMSPEKHVLPYDKRFEENASLEGTEGLETPFTVPKIQEFPVDDTFTAIAVLPSMKRKSLKVKNFDSLKYTPSWKSGSRTGTNYQDKAASLIRLSISNYDSLRRMNAKDVMPRLSQAVVVNTKEPIANKKMPEIKTEIIESETIDLKPLMGVEVANQAIVKKESIDTSGSWEETKSLEVALTSKISVCCVKDENKAWPHNRVFKTDKGLPFVSMEDEKEVKDVQPKCPEVLDLTGGKDTSVGSDVAVTAISSALPSRIAELFKEQWLSPFSVLYLTKMLSEVYDVDFHMDAASEMNTVMASGLLFELNASIQNAFKQPLKRRTRELQRLKGPVTFSSLHKLSGKNTVQSSLPVHPVLIGADGDYVSVAPNSLKSWTKLFLEPFAGQRDVAYVVVAPDTDLVLENTKQFFRELSITYESMNLGKHGPIIRVLREGIIRVQLKVKQKLANEAVDEWFSQDESAESIRMKLIAQVCKALLGPHLASLELNRTLFDKSPTEERNSAESTKPKIPGSHANPISGLTGVSTLGLIHEDADNGSSNSDLPAIVVYMIDPFQVTGVAPSKEPLWSLNGLIRAFAEMTSTFPDALKNNVFLQVVPLESILQLKASTKYHNGTGLTQQDLQHLALSVYSSCRVTINSLNSGKICTGFGPGALRDKLTKKRQVDQQFPTRVFVPPFILAPQTSLIREDPHTAMDLARVMNTGDGNILFCSYCLSHDLSWVLVTCTDKSGEIANTTIIKVHPHSRQSRESKSTRKMALRRVLNFALDVISFFFVTWRIVIHRLGNPGKGELKDLYDLSRKLVTPPMQKKRPTTPEVCVGCRATSDDKQRPTIRSVTLATVQLDPDVRILPGNNKKKSNSGSKIFVVPVVSQSAKKKDRRMLGSGSLSLPMPQVDDLIADSVFLLPTHEDEEQFMGLLSSPAEVSSSSLLTSLHSDLVQQVFSPGDAMNVSSISTMSPFQPIMHNSPALSPLPIMPQPSSTPVLKTNPSDEFTKLCRQPLCTGYILADSSSLGSESPNPSLIKSNLLFHLTKYDVQISKHPLDTDNHLELHRFLLEQLDALSWLTINPVTGKRHSSLASHIYLLTKFYETFSYFVS